MFLQFVGRPATVTVFSLFILDQIITDTLFEDLNWLLLVSSYTMTIDESGESKELPTEIIDCSNFFLTSHQQSSVASSVKYLTSIGKIGDTSKGTDY